jgi:hypothetical protein
MKVDKPGTGAQTMVNNACLQMVTWQLCKAAKKCNLQSQVWGSTNVGNARTDQSNKQAWATYTCPTVKCRSRK